MLFNGILTIKIKSIGFYGIFDGFYRFLMVSNVVKTIREIGSNKSPLNKNLGLLGFGVQVFRVRVFVVDAVLFTTCGEARANAKR